MKDGTIDATVENPGYNVCIANQIGATTQIISGNVIGNSDAIFCVGGKLSISGNAVVTSNNSRGILIKNGEVTVNGGIITAKTNASAIRCDEPGDTTILSINEGTIKGAGTASSVAIGGNATPTININGGKLVSENNHGVIVALNVSAHKIPTIILNMTGGEIDAKERGIFIDKDDTEGLHSLSKVTMTGGKITAGRYGIYNADGITIIKESTLSNDNNELIEPSIVCTGANGIYIDGGALTIGKMDNPLTISTTKPFIKAETYGINIVSGTFNFYGGTIKGKTSAIQGTPIIPAGYHRADSTDSDGFKTVWLEIDE